MACEFVVLEGEFAKRKLWSNIGLQSPKGPTWGNMGRTFVRAALNSARNVRPDDNTPQAAAARRIQGFHELDGLEFIARIDIEKDGRGESKNVVKMAVEPGETEYAALMAGAGFIPSRWGRFQDADESAYYEYICKYKQIVSSINEVGLIEPLSVIQPDRKKPEYLVLDGHLRVLALKELGMSVGA